MRARNEQPRGEASGVERRRPSGRARPEGPGFARAARALLALAVANLMGCAASPPNAAPPESAPAPPSEPPTRATSTSAPSGVDVDRRTEVAVLDPELLAALEPRGLSLAQLLGLGADASTTEGLSRSRFGSILDVLRRDVRATLTEHPTARVSSVLGTRLFEVGWLRSPEMRFELVGVFNRLDRRPWHEGTCGEVRLLFRLAYVTQQSGASMHGRLPLTLNVVYVVPEGRGCDEVARAWQPPASLDETRAGIWLVEEGALSPARRASWRLEAVETNLQTVRVQSTAHPSMGGHSEYALRVFHEHADDARSFAPAPMENLPDVERITHDGDLRRELVTWLTEPEVLRQLDLGVLRVPDRFLASGARSISPRGLARPMNRPFQQILGDVDLDHVDLSSYATIGSPKALLRRLDGLSCSGCHQTGSIAGFHHVGHDAPSAPVWSSLVSGSSAHLLADLERRRGYVEALAARTSPDERRPSAERQGREGGFGAPCGLGDRGFEGWTCEAGLRCERLEDPDVGVCLDARPIGAPCETGERIFHGRTPVGDRVVGPSRRSCGDDLGCSPNISGFPLGACAGRCDAKDTSGACVDFIDIDGLQACLRVGFPEGECAGRFAVERVDRACDAAHPCRDDFVCARSKEREKGACVPPYFVFPLRLDGYPLKR